MRALAAGGGETVIVNTCAVTGEAVRQARQAIRKAKRANPAAQVIVTGCAAQIEPQTFAAMPEVSRVLGNIDKFEPANLRFDDADVPDVRVRSEEHTSELQSLMRISYAVFCLKKKNINNIT